MANQANCALCNDTGYLPAKEDHPEEECTSKACNDAWIAQQQEDQAESHRIQDEAYSKM